MKKFLAMLLVVTMLFAMVACGNDDNKLHVGGDSDTENNESGDAKDTEEKGTPDTEAPVDEPDVYLPDPEALYGGMIGVGSEGGTAYFDNMKLTSKQSNKMVLVNTTLDKEDVMPEFTNGTNTSVVVDPLGEYDEETEEDSKNHVIATTDTMAYTGSAEWNYYQYAIKVLPENENTVVYVYFCIKDENNYFVLSLGEEGNTKADCYRVVDGAKESAAFKINNTLALDAYTAIGVTVERELINIYIDGSVKLSLFNPDFENQYYDYSGDIIPSSISECNYGAPVENGKFYPVDEANVLHDGKGTWGSSTANIASMAFDMSISTFYDCDENAEYDNGDDVAFGIAGDGTFATAYVGAYFADGVQLTHIRYSPRSGYGSRMTSGYFEASTDGENWTTIATIEESPTEGDFATVAVTDTETVFNYVRYVGPSGGYGNVAEIEFWGVN